ncbi:MAG: FAD:protein FMN transferase [Chloroflexota bacterium]
MDSKNKLSRRSFIKITAVAGGVLLGGKLLLGLADDSRVTVRETRALMGTIINLAVIAENKPAGEHAVAAAFIELERLVSIFTHRTPDSPVTILNAAGKLASPPKELVALLAQAVAISEITNGAFDVTIKPLVDLYQQSQPKLPPEHKVQEALGFVGYKKLNVSAEQIIFSQEGMAITLDGIAKGAIVDAGVAELKKLGYPNVFVEAGGDLVASGLKETGTPWNVGVQSPRQEQAGLVASFKVSDRAVATSGDYMQYYSPDLTHHHILDSQTGYSPLEVASATVVAPTCLQADALATAVTVLGISAGLEKINRLPNADALLVTKDLTEYRSRGFNYR